MSETATSSGNSQPFERSCIVLAGVADRQPHELIKGLKMRGLRPVLADGEAQVMVALAQADPAVLIVDQPARHVRLAELLEAVRAYYPKTLCWKYDSAGAGLSPIDSAPDQPQQTKRVTLDNASRWQNQLSDEQPLPVSQQHVPPPELTQDELDMLLGTISASQLSTQSGVEDDHR